MENNEHEDQKIYVRKNNIVRLRKKECADEERHYTCSICLGLLRNPVEAACGHVFCWSCIDEWYTSNKHECPQCRKHLSLNDMMISRMDKKMLKYTKPTKYVHPGSSANVRSHGGILLQDDCREGTSIMLIICLSIVFLFLFRFYLWLKS